MNIYTLSALLLLTLALAAAKTKPCARHATCDNKKHLQSMTCFEGEYFESGLLELLGERAALVEVLRQFPKLDAKDQLCVRTWRRAALWTKYYRSYGKQLERAYAGTGEMLRAAKVRASMFVDLFDDSDTSAFGSALSSYERCEL